MATLITKWFGVFLCEENRILAKRLMPKDSDEIAEKLAVMQRGGILPEESELAQGQVKLTVGDRRQSQLGKPVLFDSGFIKPESFGFTQEIMHNAMVKLGDRIECFHIHDNNGMGDQHLAPYMGVLDWNRFIEGLRAIHFSKPLSFETFNVWNVVDNEVAPELMKFIAKTGRMFARRAGAE